MAAPGGFCVPIARSAIHLEKRRILSRAIRIVQILSFDSILGETRHFARVAILQIGFSATLF